MNCESFKKNLDRMLDARRPIDMQSLTSDMISHLDGCPNCGKYLETITLVQRHLVSLQRQRMPPSLYRQLSDLGDEQKAPEMNASIRPIVTFILKFSLPGLSLWAVSLFLPAPSSVVVGALASVFGLSLMFEKTGRRLIQTHN